MSFQLSSIVNENKVFLVNLADLEGRLDPFCYIPELVELDKKIKSKTEYRLKDFSIFRASGATPSKSNDDYYSDRKNGIPFIRVQNLSVTGELNLDDLVYISKETHEGLLKRSQIKEHDLLIKITGVGRMAVASIAPDGFEGNINQHVVVVRTGSKKLSENIAAFINLDSVERIATKRATGGTRHALDYPALFSIPIINNREIYLKIKIAVQTKKQKEAEAQQLLGSIDDYLLAKLGIELPEKAENTVQSRIFTQQFKTITGKRLDPIFYSSDLDKFNSGFYDSQSLRAVSLSFISGVGAGKQDQSSEDMRGIIQIRQTNMDRDGVLKYDKNIYLPIDFQGTKIKVDDVLFNNTNSQELVGKTTILKEEKELFFSNHITKIAVNTNIIYPDYLAIILNAYQRSKIFYSMCTNWNNQSGIGLDVLKQLAIPVPPLEKQTEIANHITQIRNQAKQLQQQAKAELEQAKKEVEAMILGEA